MGARGPVGKRDDQRVRRNKPAVPTDTITTIGVVQVPPLNFEDPHPIVSDLYKSMTESAQRKYYEPSDWQIARTALHFLDGLLKSPKPNGQILATVNQMLSTLLLSEGDRRRASIEVERNQGAGDAAVVQISDVYRERLAQQG